MKSPVAKGNGHNPSIPTSLSQRSRTSQPRSRNSTGWYSAHHHPATDMPKKVVSFFPRRKEGEEQDRRLQRQISVSYEDLEALFHLPLKDAAREINLCATTFKKACRSFGMEEWPFRRGQTQPPVARITTPTLQTPELHQAKGAVMVSCTSPVWHAGSSERMDASSVGFPYSNSSVASSSSSDPSRDSLKPFGTIFTGPMALDTRSHGEARHSGQSFPGFFSAAPQGLLQQASMTHNTRSYVEARHADTVFQSFSSSAPSMALDTRSYGEARLPGPSLPGFSSAAPQGLLQQASMALPRSFSAPINTAPPREQSCVQAVMDYLEGPLVGNFEFMFVDEEGAPEAGALLDGDDNTEM